MNYHAAKADGVDGPQANPFHISAAYNGPAFVIDFDLMLADNVEA